MKHLILGYGQVGKAIHKILGKADWYDMSGQEDSTMEANPYDVIHICFPYYKDFLACVKEYKQLFPSAKLIIIHSTVPIGTSSELGAVHSPIRGVHPNLVKGIKTFVKYFGGVGAKEAASIFAKKGIKVKTTDRAENTEAMKLWDTTQYGAMILLNKEIHDFCEKHNLDFDFVYKEANKSYNSGYAQLGRSEVIRPVLKYESGKIGGHCIVQNSHLFNSKTAKRLRNS